MCRPEGLHYSDRPLLDAAAHRRDPLGVEAEPVHPSDVAGVFDLDAPVHDDGQSAGLGNPPAFFVDHRELAPETPGADSDGLPGDAGQRVRRTEHVDDVDRNRYVCQALEALLAEDLRLPGVDGDDAVPVTPEIEADEVAGAQLVSRQSDD